MPILQIRSNHMTSRVERIILCVALGAMVPIFIAALAIMLLPRTPFHMSLKRIDGRSLVQFSRFDVDQSSEEFEVAIPVDAPQSIELHSGDISVPGVTVQFHDVTLLPGRFQLRIGDKQFDVTVTGITVDGKRHAWRRLPVKPSLKAPQ